MQEMQVQSPGQEESLQKEMATQWKIQWTEEPGGLQPMGHKESEMTEWLNSKEEEEWRQRQLPLAVTVTAACVARVLYGLPCSLFTNFHKMA